MTAQNALWLKDLPWASGAKLFELMPGADLHVWQSIDGHDARVYLLAAGAPDDTWTMLIPLQTLPGASAGEQALFHYVVEADVAPEHDAELNAWYDQEHLPGLASVPGTIRAVRYRRASGSPQYLACYDLVSCDALDRPEWLAVRHTAWSSRVRPLFRNSRRTMFRLPPEKLAPGG